MKQLPTADEFDRDCTLFKNSDKMIAFAKLHVEPALKAASEKLNYNKNFATVQKEILNAYPLENIK
jgi:hypothetical protein